MTRISPSPRATIIALGHLAPRWQLLERAETARIEEWILDPGAPCALWIHGPPGSGRTTAAAAAIRRSAPAAGLSARRVAAHRDIILEEALDELGALFRQLGSDQLELALAQRSLTRSKIAVLLASLREIPCILWIDDADRLVSERTGLRDEVRYLLDGLAALDRGAGRAIIVSTAPPPPGTPSSISVSPLSPSESASLWSAAGGTGTPPAGSRRPLEVILLARASKLGASPVPRDEKDAALVSAVIEEAEAHLGKASLSALRAASALPPQPSRGALREAFLAEGLDLVLDRGGERSPLRELVDRGLMELRAEEAPEGPPLSVHDAVRDAVIERWRSADPDGWKRIRRFAARHALGTASRTGGIWPLVSAWRSLMEAGLPEDAYDVQRVFVQELVRRGHLELAREVLEETAPVVKGLARAVTLGNLAIIHKNSGDHDHALEIYRQVHAEFERLGDDANTARVLHQIGNTRYLKGDHGGALESYRKSLETSSALGDKAVAGATRIQIANIHYQRGELPEALAAYEESLDAARTGADASLIAAVEVQIGRIHFLEGRYLDAEARLREAESQATAAGDLRSLLKVYEAQAELARKLRDYDSARCRCDRAAETAASLGDALESVAAIVRTADLERERLHLAEAVAIYAKALGLLRTFAARGAGTDAELEEIAAKIGARLREMEQILGADVYARIRREKKG